MKKKTYLKKIYQFKEKEPWNSIFCFIGVLSALVTIVSALCQLFSKEPDSRAIENYEKGIIYLEDYDALNAEKYFQEAYKINEDLLDVRYYYAYTEFVLNNLDLSYEILKENRNKLNENELAFYARYECDRGDYDKCKEYFNKIQRPENLKSVALAQYVVTSLNLGALEDFSILKNRVYINTILLNRRLNEYQDLINNNEIRFKDYGIEIDKSILDDMIDRINNEAEYEISMLKMYKLYMYVLFSSYAIQYDNPEMPVYVFVEASSVIDFLKYPEMSIRFLDILMFYTIRMHIAEQYPEEVIIALKNVIEKHNDAISVEGITATSETEHIFDLLESILEDLKNNNFNPNDFRYVFPDGNTYEEINPDEVLELWNGIVQDKYF